MAVSWTCIFKPYITSLKNYVCPPPFFTYSFNLCIDRSFLNNCLICINYFVILKLMPLDIDVEISLVQKVDTLAKKELEKAPQVQRPYICIQLIKSLFWWHHCFAVRAVYTVDMFLKIVWNLLNFIWTSCWVLYIHVNTFMLIEWLYL